MQHLHHSSFSSSSSSTISQICPLVVEGTTDLEPTLDVRLDFQTRELFHMKAIALLGCHAYNSQTRHLVKKTPISMIVENSSQYILKQTFSLFAGQSITVIGKAVLDPQTRLSVRLFPNSFSISLKSESNTCQLESISHYSPASPKLDTKSMWQRLSHFFSLQ